MATIDQLLKDKIFKTTICFSKLPECKGQAQMFFRHANNSGIGADHQHPEVRHMARHAEHWTERQNVGISRLSAFFAPSLDFSG